MKAKRNSVLDRPNRIFSLAAQNRTSKLMHPGTTAFRAGKQKISIKGAIIKGLSGVVTRGGRYIKGQNITHVMRDGVWTRIGRKGV